MQKQPYPIPTVAFVCTHKRPDGHPKPCCADRGGATLRERMREMVAERGLEARIRVFASGCLGACEYGPAALSFPDGQMRFGVSEDDLGAVLDELASG